VLLILSKRPHMVPTSNLVDVIDVIHDSQVVNPLDLRSVSLAPNTSKTSQPVT
jgi:hypothetical protein